MPSKKPRAHEGPHKYQKIAIGTKGYQVYKCVLPGCNHNVQLALALNLETLCHICNTITIITKDMLIRGKEVLKPLCLDCRATRLRVREQLISIGRTPPEEEE